MHFIEILLEIIGEIFEGLASSRDNSGCLLLLFGLIIIGLIIYFVWFN